MRPRFEGWLDLQDLSGDVVVSALKRELSDDQALRLLNDEYLRSLERASVATSDTA